MHARERLAIALKQSDSETSEHTSRVSLLSTHIAQTLRLGSAVIQQVTQAAQLHDIGKIAIPVDILLKPGKLTPAEWLIMRSHTTVGAELLAGQRSAFSQMCGDVALNHHERWDGTGYPYGLAGHAIPLAARIVAVADVYDALVSRRPYKDPWPREYAIAEIRRNAGCQFDPQVVAAFLIMVCFY